MGIRKKISLGFLCLSIMLLFSGMISLFELNKMSKSTSNILEYNTHSLAIARQMLDAAQDQNTSLLQMIVLNEDDYDSVFLMAKESFDAALFESSSEPIVEDEIIKIKEAKIQYDLLISSYLTNKEDLDIEWFLDMYKTSYYNLTSSIKEYMAWSQHHLTNKASHLKNNAYRAITPGIITLFVSIIMILVFAYLLDLYYTKPTININNGLNNYLNNKSPFHVKMEGRDEVSKLKENVEQLINMCKNKKTNDK